VIAEQKEGTHMTFRRIAAIGMIALFSAPVILLARQSILLNGSLEFGPGPQSLDPHVPDGWTRFGPTAERSNEANLVPPGAGHAFKAFSSDPQVGAYQNIAAAPGNVVSITCSMYTRSGDKLGGDAQAGIALEFYRANGSLAGSHPVFALNAGSPADTWIPVSVGPFTAPAETATARFVCVWIWFGTASGSAFWDDCRLTIGTGPNLIYNGDFEIAGLGVQNPYGIENWGGFNDQEKSSDVAKDGTSSVMLGVDADYSGIYQHMATLSAGDHVYTKGWAWIPTSDPLVGGTQAGLKLEFHPNGTQPPPEENLAFTAANDPNIWTPVSLTTTVPADITIARITCIFAGSATTTGQVNFDSAWAERGSQPGVNKLLNSSFESGPGGENGLDNWDEFGVQTRKRCFEVGVTPYQGNCTARSNGTEITGIYQEVAVTPGESLLASVYAYTPGSNPLTNAVAGIKVEWRFGSVPTNVDIGPNGPGTNYVTASSARNTWLPLYIDYTMPAGSNAIVQYTCLMARNGEVTGRVYFDACEGVVLNKFNGSDADGDNDEDLLDFAQLQRAFTGTGALIWNGIVFDSDNNQLVNMIDYNYFAAWMTGPAQ
jgi:hypothetical protein